MRIQLASDLHLEYVNQLFPGERVIVPAQGADVLVLAGDISVGDAAIDLFRDWPVPVVYVAGNHEAYGECWNRLIDDLSEKALGTSVRFLERESLELDGVRFLGCTLWTDYLLEGFASQARVMESALTFMDDHRLIRASNDAKFSPSHALEDHKRSRIWLNERLSVPFVGKTVVITHHAPHPLSIAPKYAGSINNAAFVSDLTDLVRKAEFWFHGHSHDTFDYSVGNCRVVTNPLGYALNRSAATRVEDLTFENPNFQPARIIEITVD